VRPAALKTQSSAGGVIFRKHGGQPEVALIAVKGGTVWCLPKGLVDRGETPEETAVREVGEETGLRGRIVDRIGQITYWYYAKEENAKYKKTVSFYLMEFEGGSTADHDFEVDEASWFPIEEAVSKATYKGDREILLKAKDKLLHGKDNP
jgi:8-oxo-dGTP diphosphatase